MLWIALASLSVTVQPGSAATFTVTNTSDPGELGNRTLRWAIGQANSHAGADTIKFAPALAGKSIRPASPLPTLTDDETTINGDINNDGAPDILLSGVSQGTGVGLSLSNADFCTIRGLAIGRMPSNGVAVFHSHYCVIRNCYLGVNLAGMRILRNGFNGGADLSLYDAAHTTIGGSGAATRNIIGGGGDFRNTGIEAMYSDRVTISGNYIGVRRDGAAALGKGGIGVLLEVGGSSVVGGDTSGERNLFGGLRIGVEITYTAAANAVQGNYFGLAADGSTLLPIADACVWIAADARGNIVGGRGAGERNVFVGGPTTIGVRLSNQTAGNQILGNYFGYTAAGTGQRKLNQGIVIEGAAGAQTIGGPRFGGNYFGPNGGDSNTGVYMNVAGGGSTIQNNSFGIRPDGHNASVMRIGIGALLVSPKILNNRITRAESGIAIAGAGANPAAYGNEFRGCTRGVYTGLGADVSLGNLGDASTKDDGGNVFRPSNTWFIYNETPNLIKAEGNSFGTTSKAAINAKITDKLDNPAYGRVDFDPLKGGVHPTGVAEVDAVAVTSAMALPAAKGAEIAFSLSGPANVSVSVLNAAGRPVATVWQDRQAEAGLQRVLWSGQTATGTRAPAGTYLVCITARGAFGAQGNALTTLQLRR